MENGVDRMAELRMQQEPAKAMTASDFERLSRFIYAHCGIKMPQVKKTMLESRLQKRLRALQVATFRDYCRYLFDTPGGADELPHMIDAVTTNKTDFFREPVHFSFLAETALPEYMEAAADHARPPFAVWSAGCSSGEEPYTLGIVLSEFAGRNPGFRYAITATDISTRVLDKAKAGIYDEHQVEMIPLALKQRYFLRSKDRARGQVRATPALRANIAFQRLNLMSERYPIAEASLDALFCRNVIIYFDRETQGALLGRLCRYLRKGGYLFLGHSETVHGFDLPLSRMASTIYRKAV
jgi:chemotaxis protein methyltransferase CheR